MFSLLAQLDQWGKEQPDVLGLESLRLKHLTLCPELFQFIQLCPAYICVCVCMCICICIYMHTCMNKIIHICIYKCVFLCLRLYVCTTVRALLSGSYIPLLLWAGWRREWGAFVRAAKGVVVPLSLPSVQHELWVYLAWRETSRSTLQDAAASSPGRGLLLLCGACSMVAGTFPYLEWFPLTSSAGTNLSSVCLR